LDAGEPYDTSDLKIKKENLREKFTEWAIEQKILGDAAEENYQIHTKIETEIQQIGSRLRQAAKNNPNNKTLIQLQIRYQKLMDDTTSMSNSLVEVAEQMGLAPRLFEPRILDPQ
jgi:predicted nuclease with TOPRIM domain